MFDQVIYTECNPQRDLLHKGRIVHKSGYGVFSMSQELLEKEDIKNLKGLYDLFIHSNCSKEKDANIGLFGSYIYTRTQGGLWAYIYDYGRPHCKNPLKERLHRSGIHIKQCLVGIPEERPCEWFGSSVWTAWLEHEDNYYFEDVMGYEPPFLPQLSSSLPQGEGLDRRCIAGFIYDGRQRALSGAVSFVLEQLRMPPTQQKVLLIRDTPENVNCWIAAITYCLPFHLARYVTFNTNISGLNNKINAKLFYYEDANAQRKALQDSEGVNKSPCFLIAGFHPRDESCSAVKQFSAGTFVILDGEKKQLGCEQDIRKPYFQAVEQFGADIEDMCANVMTIPPEDITKADLPGLYEACSHLLGGRNDNTYYSMLDDLRVIVSYGIPLRPMCERLLDAALVRYDMFAETDRNSNYPLLEIMTKLARVCCREDDVTGCIADGLQKTIRNISDGAAFAENWRSVRNSVLGELVQPILCEVLNDTELETYYLRFPQSDPLSIETLMDMYLLMLTNEGNVADTIFSSKVRMNFLYYGMLSLSYHEEALRNVLPRLKNYDKVMDYLVFNVGAALMKNDPEKAYIWFNTVIDECGMGLMDIVAGVCGIKGVVIDQVEGYLQSRVAKTKKIDGIIVAALNNAVKTLGGQDITGVRLFEEGVRCSQLSELPAVITLIRQSSITDRANELLFDEIDQRLLLRCSDQSIDDKVFNNMSSWGRKLRRKAGCAEMREFVSSFERVADAERALSFIRELQKKGLILPSGFVRSSCWQAIMDRAVMLYDGEVYINLLTMGETDRAGEMAESLVCNALEKSSAAGYTERQMLALCSAGVVSYKVSVRTEPELIKLRKSVLDVLAFQAGNYYKPNIELKIQKSKEYDSSVRETLLKMLKDCKGSQKKPGGFGKLRNMFSRDK